MIPLALVDNRFRPQNQFGNFSGCPQAHRRAPEAGAPAHVDLRIAALVDALDEGRNQSHRVTEGPDLTGMRVA